MPPSSTASPRASSLHTSRRRSSSNPLYAPAPSCSGDALCAILRSVPVSLLRQRSNERLQRMLRRQVASQLKERLKLGTLADEELFQDLALALTNCRFRRSFIMKGEDEEDGVRDLNRNHGMQLSHNEDQHDNEDTRNEILDRLEHMRLQFSSDDEDLEEFVDGEKLRSEKGEEHVQILMKNSQINIVTGAADELANSSSGPDEHNRVPVSEHAEESKGSENVDTQQPLSPPPADLDSDEGISLDSSVYVAFLKKHFRNTAENKNKGNRVSASTASENYDAGFCVPLSPTTGAPVNANILEFADPASLTQVNDKVHFEIGIATPVKSRTKVTSSSKGRFFARSKSHTSSPFTCLPLPPRPQAPSPRAKLVHLETANSTDIPSSDPFISPLMPFPTFPKPESDFFNSSATADDMPFQFKADMSLKNTTKKASTPPSVAVGAGNTSPAAFLRRDFKSITSGVYKRSDTRSGPTTPPMTNTRTQLPDIDMADATSPITFHKSAAEVAATQATAASSSCSESPRFSPGGNVSADSGNPYSSISFKRTAKSALNVRASNRIGALRPLTPLRRRNARYATQRLVSTTQYHAATSPALPSNKENGMRSGYFPSFIATKDEAGGVVFPNSFDSHHSHTTADSTNTVSSSDLNNLSNFNVFECEDLKKAEREAKENAGRKDREKAAVEAQVLALRNIGRGLYINACYRESVLTYTDAIAAHTKNYTVFPPPNEQDEMLAALYGNRAAGLMMLGAYDAAATECNRALEYLKAEVSRFEDMDILRTDGSLALKVKLLSRLGRAYLKAGKIREAEEQFERASRTARSALSVFQQARLSRSGPSWTDGEALAEKLLNQSITDSTLNKMEVARVKEVLDAITMCGGLSHDTESAASRRNNQQVLNNLNTALVLSPGDITLHNQKVACLALMKRWVELIEHCDRLACEHVKFDGVFVRDLSQLNPFPGVDGANYLRSDAFDTVGSDGLNRVLNAKEAGEAVVRLPPTVLTHYTRALRVEERYPEAVKVGAVLEVFAKKASAIGSPLRLSHGSRYSWLSIERNKLRRTMIGKDRGDSMYRNGDFTHAADMYASVLLIDSDSEESMLKQWIDPWDTVTAGGRLHAVLHCNRAACLMALKKYRDASKECTAALRIHNQYMKAILRRARCYAQMERHEESISEYERWIQLVEEAKKDPFLAAKNYCSFDRATDVLDEDVAKAVSELSKVKSANSESKQKAQNGTDGPTDCQKSYNESFRHSSTFANGAWKGDAQSRWKQRFDQQDGEEARRWDSFGGTGPKKPSAFTRSTSGSRRGTEQPSTDRINSSRNQQQSRQDARGQTRPNASFNADTECHYAVLQLERNCTEADIKKAFRKMALKYHPDKNSLDNATDVFRRIQFAYRTLSDTVSRSKYDAETKSRTLYG